MTTARLRLAEVDQGYAFEENGLRFFRQLDEKEWSILGLEIRIRMSTNQWAIGDWLHYGMGIVPKMGRPSLKDKNQPLYKNASRILGLSRATLAHHAAVSRDWPHKNRLPNVSWSSHAAVSTLPIGDRSPLLRKMVALGWDQDELADKIAEKERRRIPPSHIVPIDSLQNTTSDKPKFVGSHPRPKGIRCPNCKHLIPRRDLKKYRE